MAGEFMTPMGVVLLVKDIEKFLASMERYNKAIVDSNKRTQEAAKAQAAAAKAAELHKKQMDSLWGAVNKAANVMLALTAAGGAALVSATKLAARVQTLGVVTSQLGKNAGKTEKEIRSLEQAIVKKGITLQASRQILATMMQAEIDLAHATDLARLAQDTAVIANLNSSEAAQQLVYVLQTGNVRMGRTLGLQLQFGKAYKKTAEILGKTTEELTEQEIMQSRVNEVMHAGTQIAGTYEAAMETVGKQMLSLPRYIEETRRAFGEALLPVLGVLIQGITKLLQGFLDLPEPLRRIKVAGILGAFGMMALVGAGLKLAHVIGTVLIPWIAKFGVTTALATGGLTLLLGAVVALMMGIGKETAETKAAVRELDNMAGEAIKARKSYKEFHKEYLAWAKSQGLIVRGIEKTTMATAEYIGVASRMGRVVEDITEAQYQSMLAGQIEIDQIQRRILIRNAEVERMIEMTSATYLLAQAEEQLQESQAELIVGAHAVATANRNMWDSMKPDVSGMIAGWLELIEFYQTGGYELQILAQQIWQAMRSGAITDIEAEMMFGPLQTAALALNAELGDEGYWDFWKALRETMTAEEAKKVMDEAWGQLPEYTAGVVDEIQAEFDTAMDPERMALLFARIGEEMPETLIPPEVLATIPDDLKTALEVAGIDQAIIEQFVGVQTAIETIDFSTIADGWTGELQSGQKVVEATIAEMEQTIETEWQITQTVAGEGPGFQHGGSFTVAGPPGVVNVPVALMATAGETITVQPAPQDNRSLTVGDQYYSSQMNVDMFGQLMQEWLGG